LVYQGGVLVSVICLLGFYLLGYLIAQLFSDIAIKAQTTATILNMLLSIYPRESSAFLKIEYGFS